MTFRALALRQSEYLKSHSLALIAQPKTRWKCVASEAKTEMLLTSMYNEKVWRVVSLYLRKVVHLDLQIIVSRFQALLSTHLQRTRFFGHLKGERIAERVLSIENTQRRAKAGTSVEVNFDQEEGNCGDQGKPSTQIEINRLKLKPQYRHQELQFPLVDAVHCRTVSEHPYRIVFPLHLVSFYANIGT